MSRKTSVMISLLLLTLVLATVATVGASEPGTVAVWHFDEETGSTAFDSSGNGNTGTLSGGRFGNALYFDGDNDYVILADNAFSNSDLDEYTFEAWITIGSLDGVERRVFDDEGGLRPLLTPGNMLQAFHWDTGANTITWSTTPATSTWYHIAQTYDGTNLKFFINGELIGTVACGAWTPDTYNREVNLGTWWQGLGRNWKGLIDERARY